MTHPDSFVAFDWSRAFCDACAEMGHNLDYEWVTGWFALALMRGWAEREKNRVEPVPAIIAPPFEPIEPGPAYGDVLNGVWPYCSVAGCMSLAAVKLRSEAAPVGWQTYCEDHRPEASHDPVPVVIEGSE